MEQCGGDGKIWDRLGLEIRNDLDAMKSGGQRGAGLEYRMSPGPSLECGGG